MSDTLLKLDVVPLLLRTYNLYNYPMQCAKQLEKADCDLNMTQSPSARYMKKQGNVNYEYKAR